MDISILKKQPELAVEVVLTITPLAPLSMVESMPGSFYQTAKYPSKKMICGLFENLLGWHFSEEIRAEIIQDREKIGIYSKSYQDGSTYNPLLMDYFKIIGTPTIKGTTSICFYTDYWNRLYRRKDDKKFVTQSRNSDYSLLKEQQFVMNHLLQDELDSAGKESLKNIIKSLKTEDKLNNSEIEFLNDIMNCLNNITEELDNNKITKFQSLWYKIRSDHFPSFYTIPTNREHIQFDGYYIYELIIDKRLLAILKETLVVNNLGYIGNSEGWVDIKIEEMYD